jgi:hypothetical protein
VAYAFLDRALNRFGAPTDVFTNQGTKFCGEFHKLCEKRLIDHCMTSRDHLEVDVLVEWMVQIVNWGFPKVSSYKIHT